MKDNSHDRHADRLTVRIEYEKEVRATTLATILTILEESYAEAVTSVLTSGVIHPFTDAQTATVNNILQMRKGAFVRIRRANRGSIELVATAGLVALFVFILRVTVGKDIEDTYAKSEMSKRIRSLLTRKIPIVHEIALDKAAARLAKQEGIMIPRDFGFSDSTKLHYALDEKGGHLSIKIIYQRDVVDLFDMNRRRKSNDDLFEL